MNRKWRNRILKKYYFLDTDANSSSRVPAVLTLLTCHCWVCINKQWFLATKIKFLLKFCVKKGTWSEIVYAKSLQTKTGPWCRVWRTCGRWLIKYGTWIAKWRPQTNSHVSFMLNSYWANIQNVHTIPFIWFSDEKLFYFCSVNEPSEWSRSSCVVNFIFSVMYFKCLEKKHYWHCCVFFLN